VTYIKEHNEANFDESASAFINNTKPSKEDEDDSEDDGLEPVYIDALRYVILSGSASISMIQRKCSVGFNKAGKIIEWMEDMGYISAFDGAKSRKVLITKEDFESKYGEL
jgi:S-DNA-T family DNA segregation ATPase FtsK/SpoIIIE